MDYYAKRPYIRWKQRFQNYEKAFQLLERTVAIKELSEAERGGLIQFFEVAFELGWKVMKDYLEEDGITSKSPREAIKEAYKAGIIEDGHTWIDALNDQNLSTHTYDEESMEEFVTKIKEQYFAILKALYDSFKQKSST